MNTRSTMRMKRKARMREKVHGTKVRPRLSVFRSNRNITVQVIDDDARLTLVAASVKGSNREAAKKIGMDITQLCKKKGVTRVIFDRSGYKYHGVLTDLATALREGGLLV